MVENFQAKESREREWWKTDERSSQYKKFRANSTFDLLLNKYTRQATVSKNRPREKRPRSPPRQEQREDTRRREEVQHEHPCVIPSVSHAANHPTGANPVFYLFPSMAPCVDQHMPYMPPLQQLHYSVWDPLMGMWVQYPLMPMLPFHLGWGAP
jgi:hypothetical protein